MATTLRIQESKQPERDIMNAIMHWYINNPDAESLPRVVYGSTTIPALDIFDCFVAYNRMPPQPVMNDSQDDRDKRRLFYGTQYR